MSAFESYPCKLDRFLEAQEYSYNVALNEIKNGRKYSHWMWYIFPQIDGLGFSSTAKYYAIQDMTEAKAYLSHEVLGKRLKEICGCLLDIKSNNAKEVFGYPDDLKLRSSMTLFHLADPDEPVFVLVLAKFFDGKIDEKTVSILEEKSNVCKFP